MTSDPASTAAPLCAADIQSLHDTLLASPHWPQQPPSAAVLPSGRPQAALPPPPKGDEQSNQVTFAHDLWHWVQRNHRYNSLLWAEEDLARRTTVADADIAANKRAIDGFNQARNDATERVDELLLLALGLVDAASARTDAPVSHPPAGARLNSETAGSMIDRLSIMALKVHAMRAQTLRTDVDEAHRSNSAAKLARLEQQRQDLGACLDALLADARSGKAYFKIYRQFKMYNDPSFNPELVKERQRAGSVTVAGGSSSPAPETHP